MMTSCSCTGAVSTYVDYKGRNYQCFDFTDRITTSIDNIRATIAAALEIPGLSSHDIVEIKNDDNNYVILNNHYLTNKHPWNSCPNAPQSSSSTKKVNLRIVSNTESQSNTLSVFNLTTRSVHQNGNSDNASASATNRDQQTLSTILEAVGSINSGNIVTTPSDTNDITRLLSSGGNLSGINDLRFTAQYLSGPLKFVYNVASQQRLQYPNEDNLVLIQTNKVKNDRVKCMQPVLQVPIDHVKFIDAGGSVELISAVVNKVFNNQDQSSYFCLARYRGFWSSNKNDRSSKDASFLNPFISLLSPTDLQKVETVVGDPTFQIKLPLCLMYAVGTKYDAIPSPLVRFNDSFVLSKAQPVPSHYNYSPHRAVTTTNEQETFNKKQCYIWCALRSDSQCNCQDFSSECVSDMFTVEPRISSTGTNNPGPRKRHHS